MGNKENAENGVENNANNLARNQSDFSSQEERVLKFWQDNRIFQKSLDKPSPRGEFVFYDGPPFATGLPHYGHILAGTMKDAIPRYRTMRGYHVERRWGWDCHGLPIEKLVQDENNLQTRADIEKFGIKKFSQAARASVFRYDAEWRAIVPRTGRWVDMDDQYTTMDPEFMESVWWAFKTLHDRGLVYEGLRSMHISPPLETSLSNFEVNLNYKDITDISVYVKFQLEGEGESATFLLAWTTTPWTLFGNAALAVNPEIEYAKVKYFPEEKLKEKLEEENASSEIYILANNLVEKIFKDKKYEVVGKMRGVDLVGKKYKPVFDHYVRRKDLKNRENAWKVYDADFVTTEDGTGIVHIAPAFGEDDLNLGLARNLPLLQHVKIDGSISDDVPELAGRQAKPKSSDDNPNAHQETDIEVIKMLAHAGLLFAKEKFTHSYPHCWRTDAPLLNYTTSSWFVRVTDFNEKMADLNKGVNWVPQAVGQKRFGNWLLNAKDWGVSRSRYWGTSMPVWKSEDGSELEVLGSIADIRQRTKSTNKYFVMRHGEAEHNVGKFLSADDSVPSHLTDQGRSECQKAAKDLLSQIGRGEKIDKVYCSPLIRSRETAEIVMRHLNISEENLIVDDRLREVQTGVENGKTEAEFSEKTAGQDRFVYKPEGGENWTDIKKRMGDFIYDIDQENSGKNILIVSHDWPIWMLFVLNQGLKNDVARLTKEKHMPYIATGEFRSLDFAAIPHDDEYVLDLHRPYIDEITYKKNNKIMRRIADVFDGWVDSGSMPFAVPHYPFSDKMNPRFSAFRNGKIFDQRRAFPADFIAEGLDQTRGWFYTLLALGTSLFGRSPFKNVIVNGLVLAEDGQKMSKRLKNYPDPISIFNKYGADSARYYLLSSQIVEAEPLFFSEKGVDEVYKKIVLRLLNVVSFFEMYKEDESGPIDRPGSQNILDRWILARLDSVISETTNAMEAYKLNVACRPFMDFVDDLSTWYIRRSRDRFKISDIPSSTEVEDRKAAMATTRYVLIQFSKIIAPFMPFLAEMVWQRLMGLNFSESDRSVHLEDWPTKIVTSDITEKTLTEMRLVREIVSDGLLARDRAGIRVRQPLSLIKINIPTSALDDYSLELIKDELNVKEIVYDDTLVEGDGRPTDGDDPSQSRGILGERVWLDTRITEELREEGEVREMIRSIQSLRKSEKLNPNDRITIEIYSNDNETSSANPENQKTSMFDLVKKYEPEITKAVRAAEIKIIKDASHSQDQSIRIKKHSL